MIRQQVFLLSPLLASSLPPHDPPVASVVIHPHPTTPKLDDSVEIQPKSYDDNLENQDDVNLEFNNDDEGSRVSCERVRLVAPRVRKRKRMRGLIEPFF